MNISSIIWITIALILVALVIKENREMALNRAEMDPQKGSENNSIDDLQKNSEV